MWLRPCMRLMHSGCNELKVLLHQKIVIQMLKAYGILRTCILCSGISSVIFKSNFCRFWWFKNRSNRSGNNAGCSAKGHFSTSSSWVFCTNHHKFGSRFLNNTTYKLGFGVSYDEVQKFEVSAAITQGTHIPGITDMHHIQYIADNVDHNICTIDGYGTFHGMGSIATITPGIKQNQIIKRLKSEECKT